MRRRVDAAVEARGQAQHRERPVRVARNAEDEHLAVGAGTLELRRPEGNARDLGTLGRRQHGERVESELRADLARPEDGIPEQSAGGVESFDLVGGHQPPS